MIKLKDFQKDGVALIELMGGNCIVGDDMGLGKTIQAIYYCIKNKKNALIVCPANLKTNWGRELKEKFNATYVIINKSSEMQKIAPLWQFIIMPYTICQSLYKQPHGKRILRSGFFDTMIIDESTFVKNSSSKRGQAVRVLSRYFKHRILLSGTPLQNSIEDIYAQIKIVNPHIFQNKGDFRRILGLEVDRYNKILPPKQKSLKKLQNLISCCYFSRKKHDILDITQKKRQIEYCNIDQNTYINIINESKKTNNQLQAINYIRQKLAMLIVEHTIQRINKIKNNSKKIIIYTAYKAVSYKIADILGNCCIVYNGDSGIKKREILKNDFLKNNKKTILVATIQSCAFGIDQLQRVANKVIFNDVTYVPSEAFQAEDRVYRMGISSDVEVLYMAFKNTYHEEMFTIMQKKYNIYSDIFLTDEQKNNISNDVFNIIFGAKK